MMRSKPKLRPAQRGVYGIIVCIVYDEHNTSPACVSNFLRTTRYPKVTNFIAELTTVTSSSPRPSLIETRTPRQVGKAAFGATGGVVTTAVLLVMTIFVMIAYMVLVRDIWAGLAAVILRRDLDEAQSNQAGVDVVAFENAEHE